MTVFTINGNRNKKFCWPEGQCFRDRRDMEIDKYECIAVRSNVLLNK